MEIGEKIKRLRSAKLMTQAELAGSEITRNMLSRIENGAAQPSMGTVRYIAERLGVSPGFLLAGEEDEQLYFKSQEIDTIKKLYSHKKFRLCMDICKNSEWRDDELMLIEAESCLRVGAEEFSAGNLRAAMEFFEQALECSSETIYNTDVIAAEISAYFNYMHVISPTLYSDAEYEEQSGRLMLTSNAFCVYSGIFCDAQDSSFDKIPFLGERIELLDADSSYALHISARLMMEKGNYEEANKVLHRLLFDDCFDFPEPMLYFVFCDLEVCCKETGDFKGAYEYSGNKLTLLQKLIF